MVPIRGGETPQRNRVGIVRPNGLHQDFPPPRSLPPREGENLHAKRAAGKYRSDSDAGSPPGMGTIMIRFVGLLVVAVAVLALVWSR